MEAEQDKFTRLYSEMDDEHLQDLAADPDSLTPAAELALRRILVARGFAAPPTPGSGSAIVAGAEHEQGFTPGIPGMFPSSAGAVEQALDPAGAEQAGMVNLITFYDGHELSKACAALEAASVDLTVQEQDRDELSGAPPSFALWVAPEDRVAAVDVLRARLGLFPLAELEGQVHAPGELVPLGEFQTAAETEQVRALLTQANISSKVERDADEPGTWQTILVPSEDLDRALAVAAEGLALE